MKYSSKTVATGGIIAACYTLLTLLSNLFGLGSGLFQVRISEALCALPCYTPAAVPGLFTGCLLANLLSGGEAIDVVLGSIATLIGAAGTRLLRRNRHLALLPPILANTLIVPVVLSVGYGIEGSYMYMAGIMLLSELISCGLLGECLYKLVDRSGIFGSQKGGKQ